MFTKIVIFKHYWRLTDQLLQSYESYGSVNEKRNVFTFSVLPVAVKDSVKKKILTKRTRTAFEISDKYINF